MILWQQTVRSQREKHARIAAIEYCLPEQVLTTADLVREYPDWSVEKIDSKTGISVRHIAAEGECASDLAVRACESLFAACPELPRASVDFILLCTQTPDYFLPTTACLVQNRLGIPTHCGALDFNLGCSGFVYGLGVAEGLIATGQATNILLITTETYSKFIDSSDRSVRTIFGDAAVATLVIAADADEPLIGPFVYGTDGAGAPNLIVETGGARSPLPPDDGSTSPLRHRLYMNGPEIFQFTLSAVPAAVAALLDRSGLLSEQIDLFVFHQANQYMLEHLRRHMRIPVEKFFVCMSHCGNTVSSTIPIALKHAADSGVLRDGMKVALVGFGVGYSWGATLVTWKAGITVIF